MDSLVQDRIYRRVALVDYQGACSDQNSPYSAAPVGTRPAALMSWFIGHLIKVCATWLAMMPQRTSGWASFAQVSYEDGVINMDQDESYSEDYDDESPSNRFDDERDVYSTPPVNICLKLLLL